MNDEKKIRVALLYGGRSGEHEVSLQSAASVLRHLDAERFEVVPVGIAKDGRWHVNDLALMQDEPGQHGDRGKELPIFPNAPQVLLSTEESGHGALVPHPSSPPPLASLLNVDIFFPLVHGSFGEDGTLQGMLELANVPYVGAGVLASAVGMDKDFAKRLARAAGVPIVPYFVLRRQRWPGHIGDLAQQIDEGFKYPVFVKPANLGSSVGVHRVAQTEDLEEALADAFRYDDKVLVEKAIRAREIEVSVLEAATPGTPPLVSVAGEVIPDERHDFYSYDAKYLDEKGALLEVPAKLSAHESARAREIAGLVFQALECEGMARIDLFLEKESGKFYFNEINTIPGFTAISMYPRLFEASGISYRDLLTRLVELGLARHERGKKLRREYGSGV